jgi:hypothetical protein
MNKYFSNLRSKIEQYTNTSQALVIYLYQSFNEFLNISQIIKLNTIILLRSVL